MKHLWICCSVVELQFRKVQNKTVNMYSNAINVYYVKMEYFHVSLNKFLG